MTDTDQTIGPLGDSRVPKCDIETIVRSELRQAEFGRVLRIRTNRFLAISIEVEHKDRDRQELGQQALQRLLRACAMTDVDKPEDFIGMVIQWRWSACEIDKWYTGKLPKPARHAVDPTQSQPVDMAPPVVEQKEDGRFVYVIACVDSNTPLCKIGIANSAEKRVKTLGTSSPHTLRLELARYTDCARDVEAAAHVHFASKRRNGEWFEMPSIEAISYVNQAIEGRA